MYRQINAPLDQFLLDPNNPRCAIKLDSVVNVPDSQAERLQAQLLAQFDRSGVSDIFPIDDLIGSFKQVGYIPIDRVVVRRTAHGKLIVVEGNRRVSALKVLKERHDKRQEELEPALLAVMASLPAMELVTEGLSDDEVHHRISTLLGIRHHGSLLEWEPLPRAFSIYQSFMATPPRQSSFRFDAEKRGRVAMTLSIKPGEVTKGLRTYIAFQQLKALSDSVLDKHFSLVEAAVTGPNLFLNDFLKRDESTFQLADESAAKLMDMCQFDVREARTAEQIIVPRPQSFSKLGTLVKKANGAIDPAIQGFAKKQLDDVLSADIDSSTGNLKTSLEDAVDAVTAMESQVVWREALEAELAKVDFDNAEKDQLWPKDFVAEGNELEELEKLIKALRPFKLMLGVA